MKIKKAIALILSISSILLAIHTASLSSVFAVGSPIATPVNSSESSAPNVAQNSKTNKPSENVAPKEATAPLPAQTPPSSQTPSSSQPSASNQTPNKQNTPKATPDPSTPPASSTHVPTTETAPTLSVPSQSIEQSKSIPKIKKSAEENVNNEIESEDSEKEDEQSDTPKDLPDVESDEILFPEVISPSENTSQKPKNLLAGIIAWTCIAIGIAIVIFILINGRKKGNIEPKAMKIHSSGRKKKAKRLLDDKYYKKR